MKRRKAPDLHQAAFDAGDLYIAGRHDEAIAILRGLVRRAPRDGYVLSMLGYALLDSDPSEAETLFLRAAEMARDDPATLLYAARGLVNVLNWGKAEAVCSRIALLAPANFPLRTELEQLRGCVMVAQERYAEALPLLLAAYNADPSLDNGNSLAETYGALEMYDDLVIVVETGLRRKPDDRYLLDLKKWIEESAE